MTASTHSSPTAPVLSIRCGPSGLELWPLENFGETVRASGDCRDMRGRSLVLGSGAAANRLSGRLFFQGVAKRMEILVGVRLFLLRLLRRSSRPPVTVHIHYWHLPPRGPGEIPSSTSAVVP